MDDDQDTCDRCGHPLQPRNCKEVCPRCGARLDCSDVSSVYRALPPSQPQSFDRKNKINRLKN